MKDKPPPPPPSLPPSSLPRESQALRMNTYYLVWNINKPGVKAAAVLTDDTEVITDRKVKKEKTIKKKKAADKMDFLFKMCSHDIWKQ